MSASNEIKKQITLKAPIHRVWQAITNSTEFSKWFGVQLQGPFVEGQPIKGTFGGKLDETKIIEHQKKLGVTPSKIRLPDGEIVFCTVQRIEPERYFSFRWFPFGIDAEADLTTEPMTLVEFILEPVPEGTLLTIVESGFDQVPEHRRLRAFRMNEGGWAAQANNLGNYVQST